MKNACGLASKVREEGEGTCSVGQSTSDQNRGQGGLSSTWFGRCLAGMNLDLATATTPDSSKRYVLP